MATIRPSSLARGGDNAVTKVVRCPACGEVSSVPSCPSCGAELLTRGVGQIRDHPATDRDQTRHEQDQTWSDADQTVSDQDQTWSDHDQTASASDQRSANEDQHAADDDLAAGGDRGAYDRSALARERSSRDRAAVSAVRDESAAALRHRMESADDLRFATTDELTGAWTRRFGLEEVSRELERAHRTGASLVVAFIDVDGLKQVNDTQGHLAGDTLLRLVGETLRANVRPYDVIVRYGGDELLCAMPNLSAPEARARFKTIAAALKAVDAEHSVTFGLAEAEP